MRDIFYGYYPPKEVDFENLWKNGLIVLDTNVLLNLYRLPETARKDFLGILNKFSSRIWVPHQVALEFQRKRLSVIASERKITEDALKKASASIQDIKQNVERLQLDKRQFNIDVQTTIQSLDDAKEKLLAAIKYAHEAQIDISASDSIRDELDEILLDRIGPGPADQQTLDQLYLEGHARYQDNIPPGFSDADKDKNPSEATFIHCHIKHQAKYGDFILWKQTIDHVKTTNAENIIFVTADKKEDWWWKEQGKTLGPHPELIQEIRRGTSVKLFWLYSPDQFLEHATKFAAAQVSAKSVQEIKDVSVFSDSFARDSELSRSLLYHIPNLEVIDSHPNSTDLERVAEWFKSKGSADVNIFGLSFPNIVAELDGQHIGFAVRRINFAAMDFASSILRIIENKAQMVVSRGDIDSYGFVIILPDENSSSDNYIYYINAIVGKLRPATAQGRSKWAIFGVIKDQGFHMVAEWRY